MRFLLSLIISIAAHIGLGWGWSVIGGITCGYWLSSKGGVMGALSTGFMGAICVGLGWAALVAYNFFSAPAETEKMLGMMGGILGNLDGSLIVVLTILIGAILGMLGGLVGNQFKRMRSSYEQNG